MVRNAREFGEKDPKILRARGDFEIEQFLDRKHEAVLHAQRRAIIEPIEIGQRLHVRLILDQLFGAAVQQPDMRIDALDDFAVELHHEAQHAMRSRVLRAEIDRVILDRDVADFGAFRVGLAVDLVEIIGH